VGLREIKRRASRHALIHRDSFSGTKSTAVSAPGTPNEQPTDSMDARLLAIEQSLFEMSTRLARSEENNSYLAGRCQMALDGLSRCHQWTADIAQFISQTFPADSPVLRDVQSLQREMERHSQLLEEPHDLLRDRQPFAPAMDSGAPLSPRQRPVEDDSRRSSFSGSSRPGYFRPPAPPHMSNPPRRLASVGMPGSASPNSLRPQPNPHQPIPHPLSHLQSPPIHLSRRHTSADIRQHGWQVNSPFSGIGTPHWPPSPSKPPNDYRDGSYEMPQHPRPSIFASQTTPPLSEATTGSNEGGWSFGNARFPLSREAAAHTAPPTRRSSLASSSVHALLNPPEGKVDRDGASDGEPDDRKRKRIT